MKKIEDNLNKLTNPDKILFKKLKISKRMLAEFYVGIKDWILPYIINRPLTILRCPSGTNKPCFFQKHPNEPLPPGIACIEVKSEGKTQPYLYIKDITD